MFKRILCALDGSEHSLRAARLACDLAVKFDAELTFLTVTKRIEVNDTVRRFMELERIVGEPQYVLDEMTESILNQAKACVREHGVKSFKTDVQVGNPARTIVSRANRDGVDLIVMGRRGIGDIEGALLGSVSHKVASLASCTVMTVK
jgi:nucleotide-binding universal stress UspA family protein